jgi:hypothetical protein
MDLHYGQMIGSELFKIPEPPQTLDMRVKAEIDKFRPAASAPEAVPPEGVCPSLNSTHKPKLVADEPMPGPPVEPMDEEDLQDDNMVDHW